MVTAVAVMAVTAVAVMAVVTAVAVMAVTAVAVMAVTAVAVMAAVIPNLRPLTLINPLEQKGGKIEVMETPPKVLTSKMAEVEEKEVYQVILKSLKKLISNLLFEAL